MQQTQHPAGCNKPLTLSPVTVQTDIVQAVDVGAARKVFDLQMPQLGPYCLKFSRNGRFMLLGGRKGHLGLMDWQAARPFCEVQVSTHTVANHSLADEHWPLANALERSGGWGNLVIPFQVLQHV